MNTNRYRYMYMYSIVIKACFKRRAYAVSNTNQCDFLHSARHKHDV